MRLKQTTILLSYVAIIAVLNGQFETGFCPSEVED